MLLTQLLQGPRLNHACICFNRLCKLYLNSQIQRRVHGADILPAHHVHVVHLLQSRPRAMGLAVHRGVHAEAAGQRQEQTKGE